MWFPSSVNARRRRSICTCETCQCKMATCIVVFRNKHVTITITSTSAVHGMVLPEIVEVLKTVLLDKHTKRPQNELHLWYINCWFVNEYNFLIFEHFNHPVYFKGSCRQKNLHCSPNTIAFVQFCETYSKVIFVRRMHIKNISNILTVNGVLNSLTLPNFSWEL